MIRWLAIVAAAVAALLALALLGQPGLFTAALAFGLVFVGLPIGIALAFPSAEPPAVAHEFICHTCGQCWPARNRIVMRQSSDARSPGTPVCPWCWKTYHASPAPLSQRTGLIEEPAAAPGRMGAAAS